MGLHRLRLGVAAVAAPLACLLGACGEDATTLGVFDMGDASPTRDAPAGPDSSGSSSGSASDAGSAPTPAFLLGADISSVQQAIAEGAQYYDVDGTQKDILVLLKGHGFNFVRLRTFVDPTQAAPDPEGGASAPYSTQGYCDLAHTVTFAQGVKAAGLGFVLDFHYSDTWADPGSQIKPAAWVTDDLAAITTALHDYTKNAISTLVAAGARPDIVQVGNEITPGIELTPGVAMGPASNWVQLAQLLRAGVQAIHEVDPGIRIMLHLDRCADPTGSASFIKNAMSNGVPFDVLGQSCYVTYQGPPSGWQTTFTTLAASFPTLKFMMAEYNADLGDSTEIRRANDIVFSLPNHQGLGAFIWEPTESGGWGPGIFTRNGNAYTANPAAFQQYDAMRAAYGL
jgi:arabinogalactan endo-1,4-beta-galactosidase